LVDRGDHVWAYRRVGVSLADAFIVLVLGLPVRKAIDDDEDDNEHEHD
jgi:hypothetical protein